MKIRFYTNNKEAIVFDLEDILKQLNIEEQVATVGLVIEKDEAEVEAIAQTIQFVRKEMTVNGSSILTRISLPW